MGNYDNGDVAFSDTGAVSRLTIITSKKKSKKPNFFLFYRWKLLDDGLTFERQEVTCNIQIVFATFFADFLSIIQARSSFGLYSVHLALSKRDRMAVSSNYWGASVAAYALEGGREKTNKNRLCSKTCGGEA